MAPRIQWAGKRAPRRARSFPLMCASRPAAIVHFTSGILDTGEASKVDIEKLIREVGLVAVYAIVGMALFGLAFYIMVKICPFSVRKEIEEDQNTSLAILMGSVLIGIALIVAAAIHG